MSRYPLFDALNPNEFLVMDNTAFGVMGGYPFMMIYMAYLSAHSVRVAVTTDAAIDRNLFSSMKKQLREQGIKAVSQKRVVSAVVKIKKDSLPGEVLAVAAAIVDALRGHGVLAPNRCAICGQPGHDAYMLCGGVQASPGSVYELSRSGCYDTVHASCVTRMSSEMQNRADENPGSYIMGILGALIGAVVGAIPAIAAIVFLEVISAWLFMLIPIATRYGYKKLGGKMDRASTVFSVLFSLVGLGLVLLSWDVAENMRWLGQGLLEAIGYTLQNMLVPGYWSWMGGALGSILLFFIIGMVFSFGKLMRTNKSAVVSVEKLRQTLMHRREN